MKISKQMIQLAVVFRIFEIFREALCNHRADSIDRTDLLFLGCPDLVQIIIKMPADHSRIGKSDVRDSKTVDHLRKCCLLCFVNAYYKIVIGFLAKTFHCHDLFSMPCDLKNISKIMDKTFGDEFLQCSFRQSVYIHGISAYKECECLDLLRNTVRVHAVERFYFIFLNDPGFLTADRTDMRDFQITAPGQVLCDLRNDHICLVDLDRIADPKL